MRWIDGDKLKDWLEWAKATPIEETDNMDIGDKFDMVYIRGWNHALDKAISYIYYKEIQKEE